MAIDLKKMRAKLDAAKNKGGKTWKPAIDSATKVRIIPTPDGDPFKEKHFHYNLGKQSVLCPKRNFDEHCPVCEFASELWNSGDPESKEMAKKLFVRQRFYSPIILRDEKEPTVKVWAYSQSVYQELLSTCLNPEYGDISDPSTGTDFVIKYEKGSGDSQYPTTKLVYSRQPSSLCDDLGDDKCAELLGSTPDFDELYERKTSQQVREILDEYLDSDGDSVSKDSDSETESDSVKYNGSVSESTDVDGALDDLKPSKKANKA